MNEQTGGEPMEPEEPGLEETGPPDKQSGEGKGLIVVGIGASAGGLAALQAFFDALPPDTGMAFVVITHMDPERESLLPELLQRHTAMTVQQVQGLVAIEKEHVYVISPNQRIRVTDTHLDTEGFEEPRGRRTPIDYFFRSLANAHSKSEQPPVAIILSGGGTDGAVGVKAIKEEGGLLLVQEPEEAEYDSMPRAAINTGLADVVLPVAELAQKLVTYQRNGVRVPTSPEALTPEQLDTLFRILTEVQTQTGHDFSQYKRSTLLRRIQRRMQLNGHSTLDAYLGTLRHDPAEAHALFNDLLIGVTNFFRDRDAWEALAEQVIPRLFQGKEAGAEGSSTVRVWSIGCATGEEAYSLAILLLEHHAQLAVPLPARPQLQIFASDLDDQALTKAREGIYPEAIEADVSAERLGRWFVKEGHHYRVRQELRDIVLFSNHSVLRDPPFSRVDLISCRNLLIYLNRELQESVFQIFHYALKPEAYLFLGSSESAEVSRELFHVLDKEHRIYRARPWRGEHPEVPTLPLTVRLAARRQLPDRRRPAGQATSFTAGVTEGATHLEMLEEAAPPSILVDEHFHALHLSPTAGRYLQLPGGALASNLLKLVRPELKAELRTALFRALEEERRVVSAPVAVELEGAVRSVTLAVRPRRATDAQVDKDVEDGGPPLKEDGGAGAAAAAAPGKETPPAPGEAATEERLALVFFLEDDAPVTAAAISQQRVAAAEAGEAARPARGDEAARDLILARLDAENQHLRERLQATAAEYESSNEELKAANEELQSINEEYRSTTEELETSKEELQSVNEELQTVNNELKNKLEEISRAHSDMENLMAATDIATLFLDRQLRIQRYTPAVADLFNVIPGDRGRPLGHLTNTLEYDALAEDAARVLNSLVPIEREVRDGVGNWFLAQLRPYRTMDDRIDGVVLTFVGVTALKEAEMALRESERQQRQTAESLAAERKRLRAVLANLPVAVWIADDEGRLIDKNEQADRLWAGDAPLVEGVEAYTAYTAWDADSGQTLQPEEYPVARALRTGQTVAPVELKIRRFDGSEGTVLVMAAPIRDDEGRLQGAVGVNLDITGRKQAEEVLRRRERELARLTETLEARVRERTVALERARVYSEKIVDTVREGLLVLQPDLTIEFANDSFYEMFAAKEEETKGELIYRLGNGQWDIPELRRLLEEILPEQNVFNDYRVEHTFESVGRRVMLLNARRLDELERILLAIEDVTGRDGSAMGGEQ